MGFAEPYIVCTVQERKTGPGVQLLLGGLREKDGSGKVKFRVIIMGSRLLLYGVGLFLVESSNYGHGLFIVMIFINYHE